MSGNPDVERRSETFKEEWVSEAVMRYFYNKLQQRRAELEQAINQQNKRDWGGVFRIDFYVGEFCGTSWPDIVDYIFECWNEVFLAFDYRRSGTKISLHKELRFFV